MDITMTAWSGRVPEETVADAGRHEQQLSGPQRQLIVVERHPGLAGQHPDELEVVQDAGRHLRASGG